MCRVRTALRRRSGIRNFAGKHLEQRPLQLGLCQKLLGAAVLHLQLDHQSGNASMDGSVLQLTPVIGRLGDLYRPAADIGDCLALSDQLIS